MEFFFALGSAWGNWAAISGCFIHEGGCMSDGQRFCEECSECTDFGCSVGTMEVGLIDCLNVFCPTTNGEWGAWSTDGLCVGDCSVSSTGEITHSRQCNDPTPLNGGADCVPEGSITDTKTESCSLTCTAIDGMWGPWVDGVCEGDCGTGSKTLTRACDDPPRDGGADCVPEGSVTTSKTEPCALSACEATWTTWMDSGDCSATCDIGQIDQERFCTGTGCETGYESRLFSCNDGDCPMPIWTIWADVEDCSVTCGSGTISRERFCNVNCEGVIPAYEFGTFSCDLGECPGEWNAWDTTPCTASCGSGVQTSSRVCEGGSYCIPDPTTGYENTKSEACEDGPCTSWTNWVTSECDPTCGAGTATNSRECQPTGYTCEKEDGEFANVEEVPIVCNNDPCIIDGLWTNWEEVGDCPVSCGGSVVSRTRSCSDPTPQNGGSACSGSASDETTCNTQSCAVDGGWSTWEEWSDCSVSCNAGVESRDRTCTNPEPANGGEECDGVMTDERPCLVALCDTNADWSDWSDWSVCSVTCEDGVRTSSRYCLNPPNCEQDSETITESCDDDDCRLNVCPDEPGECDCNFENDCGWLIESSSNAWRIVSGPTTSTKTGPSGDHTFPDGCGNYAYYEASCGISPALFASQPKVPVDAAQCLKFYLSMFTEPEYAVEMGSLKVFIWQGGIRQEILVRDGVQSISADHWQEVQVTLDVSLGQPFSIIFEATNNGLKSDMAIDDITIIDGICDGPVVGNWGLWGEWSCDQSCGEGTGTRSRECDSPAPLNSGRDCDGVSSETRDCVDYDLCPIHGGWTDWADWSDCTRTCETGERYSTRECTDPEPENNGDQCEDLDLTIITETCNSLACTIDGMWGEWGEYDTGCDDLTCGDDRFATKTRQCDSPPPYGDGEACSSYGEYLMTESETISCEDISCPVDGGYSDWSGWGECSETCGSGGLSFKYRSCDDPAPEGGELCDGPDTDYQTCYEVACPIHGGWSEWVFTMGDEDCSESCIPITEAPRTISKHRSCDDPAPEGTGDECEFHDFTGFGAYDVFEETCTTAPCPVDGGWSDWAGPECSASCNADSATVTLTRVCDDPTPLAGGLECEGFDVILIPCIQDDCPGSWSDWTDDTGNCFEESAYLASGSVPPSSGLTEVTCGSGIYEAARSCDKTITGYTQSCVDEDGNFVDEEDVYQAGSSCVVSTVCPVDGDWGSWIDGSCNAVCGWGQLQKVRTCDDPAPVEGGSECFREDGSETSISDREEVVASDPSIECYFQHCNPDASPLDCNFEDMAACGALTVSDGSRWHVRNTQTSTTETGPGAAAVYTAGYHMVFESSSGNDDGVAYGSNDGSFSIAYTSMTLSNTDPQACLQFYYHFYTSESVADVGDFKVTLIDNGGNENVVLELNQPTDDDEDEWKRFRTPIDNANLATVSFYARRTGSYGDKAIDRINFYPVECDKIVDFNTAV